MFWLHALAFAAVALAACASEDRPPVAAVGRFSEAPPGAELPRAWQPWILDPRKPQTRYALVQDDGRTVLRAEAERSVSGLLNELRFDHGGRARLRWRWKVDQLARGDDATRAQGDDCAARVVVSFAGDLARLDATERAKLSLAAAFSGREAPYATLMYIWSAKHVPETVIVNPRSSRVRMIVVEQGAARLGRWLDYERDIVADFQRAFGEDAGVITAIGVLTDADDTESSALAHYGDITLR